MTKGVLLLTACISPNGMSYTKLQDSVERKKQYVEAVNYYLQTTNYRIVFCNNSGEQPSDIFPNMNNEYKKRLEVFSFSGNNYEVSLGKGYGELSIIRYAFEHSRFIDEATMVIKITGRLKIINLMEVDRTQRIVFGKRKEFVYLDIISKNGYDSRCFMANKAFYLNALLYGENRLNDSVGYWFEHHLYDVTIGLPNGYVVSDFVLPLSIIGQSGTTGEFYGCQSLSGYEKLCSIREYCKRTKNKYKKDRKLLYCRLSLLSFVSHVCKNLIRMKSDCLNYCLRGKE